MGIFSRFEGKMEDTFEGMANSMYNAPISPVQIAKKAEKQMRREKMVGAGKQYAPTLYTVLVNPDDDRHLFGYYPTLAGETETYLAAKASEQGLSMDGQPLVRFIVDENLRHGKFEVIAESVAAPIISQLRSEEMQRYGLEQGQYGAQAAYPANQFGQAQAAVAPAPAQGMQQPQAAPEQFAPYAQQQAPAAQVPMQAPAPEFQPAPPMAPAAQGANIDEPAYAQAASVPEAPAVPNVATPPEIYDQEYDVQPQAQQAEFAPEQQVAPGQPQAQSAPPMAQAHTMVLNQGAVGQPSQSAADASQRLYCLFDANTHQKFNLNGTHVTVGRESRNTIPVADINVSRKHAELTLTSEGVWVVTDLGSTNGTFVNGQAVASQPLNPGDIVAFGSANFEFKPA